MATAWVPSHPAIARHGVPVVVSGSMGGGTEHMVCVLLQGGGPVGLCAIPRVQYYCLVFSIDVVYKL